MNTNLSHLFCKDRAVYATLSFVSTTVSKDTAPAEVILGEVDAAKEGRELVKGVFGANH